MHSCAPGGTVCVHAATFSTPPDAGGDAAPLPTSELDQLQQLTDEKTFTRSPPAACQVCHASEAYFFVSQSVASSPKKGQRFLAKAWVRAAETKTVPQPVRIVVTGKDSKDMTVVYAEGATVTASSTWTEVNLSESITVDSAVELTMRIGTGFADKDECFLVDDASLVFQ